MVWSSPTMQIAADELVRRASSRSWEREGRLKDDVTCVVVDLNPSQRTYEPVLATGRGAGAEGACCVVC